jgi:TolB-like protein
VTVTGAWPQLAAKPSVRVANAVSRPWGVIVSADYASRIAQVRGQGDDRSLRVLLVDWRTTFIRQLLMLTCCATRGAGIWIRYNLFDKEGPVAREQVERRLMAILAADVAGYSQLMGADEEGTLAQLKAHRSELVDPKIEEHHGRIIKTTGDGMLVEFASSVNALRCAVEIQRGMLERNCDVPYDKRIEFRIGINVGDIIIDGSDIFGDVVNVAARLEGLAKPGDIYISERVYEDTQGRLDVEFDEVGEHTLKNIARPVDVYCVLMNKAAARASPALPDKPSVAVLPFDNISGDPEQEYFADGIVEDIITALSRFRVLFVIARNSSFTYKGRPVDVRQVGHELGVRYVVEGSVRKATNRVRITAQLIDTDTGAHLWADYFDGALEHVFDLQDQVTTSVVNAITPKVEQAEIERAKRKPTESLDAYDYFLRGLANFYRYTQEANNEALLLFDRAIELDPDFAMAYGMAAWCYNQRDTFGWIIDRKQEVARAVALGWRAVELGREDAGALACGGIALARFGRNPESGIAFIDRARALNPNFATAWYFSGWVNLYLGNLELSITHFAHCMRLSPLDPIGFMMQAGTAFAHFLAHRNDEALSWAERALREKPICHPALRIAAATNAFAGRMEEAQKIMMRLRQVDPALRISNLKDKTPLCRSEDMARYVEGMRKAGLPE